MIWNTQDGKQIHVKDMDATHLSNTIEMLRRNNGDAKILDIILYGQAKLIEAKAEAMKNNKIILNGDIAQMMQDQMLDDEYGPEDGEFDSHWD
jgi:hypothetical protein